MTNPAVPIPFDASTGLPVRSICRGANCTEGFFRNGVDTLEYRAGFCTLDYQAGFCDNA